MDRAEFFQGEGLRLPSWACLLGSALALENMIVFLIWPWCLSEGWMQTFSLVLSWNSLCSIGTLTRWTSVMVLTWIFLSLWWSPTPPMSDEQWWRDWRKVVLMDGKWWGRRYRSRLDALGLEMFLHYFQKILKISGALQNPMGRPAYLNTFPLLGILKAKYFCILQFIATL